jgi:hypothetical protein
MNLQRSELARCVCQNTEGHLLTHLQTNQALKPHQVEDCLKQNDLLDQSLPPKTTEALKHKQYFDSKYAISTGSTFPESDNRL